MATVGPTRESPTLGKPIPQLIAALVQQPAVNEYHCHSVTEGIEGMRGIKYGNAWEYLQLNTKVITCGEVIADFFPALECA
jgi:hypothetical protein